MWGASFSLLFVAQPIFESGWSCSLLWTLAQLCGRISASLDLGTSFYESTFLSSSKHQFLLEISLAISSLDIFQWLLGPLTWPLGFCLILVCVCTRCIIPDEVYVAWERLNFQFMLWYMERISVLFRTSDYVQTVQLTYKLNSDRDMQREKGKEEEFVGKQPYRLTCFMIWIETVWSDSTKTGGFIVRFGFFFPSVLTVTYYVPLGKSLSEFLSLPTLYLLFGLQTHQGNGASPWAYLYSTELSRTVFLIRVFKYGCNTNNNN